MQQRDEGLDPAVGAEAADTGANGGSLRRSISWTWRQEVVAGDKDVVCVTRRTAVPGLRWGQTAARGFGHFSELSQHSRPRETGPGSVGLSARLWALSSAWHLLTLPYERDDRGGVRGAKQGRLTRVRAKWGDGRRPRGSRVDRQGVDWDPYRFKLGDTQCGVRKTTEAGPRQRRGRWSVGIQVGTPGGRGGRGQPQPTGLEGGGATWPAGGGAGLRGQSYVAGGRRGGAT